MEQHQKVLVFDYGSQYNQLLARRVREHNVLSELISCKTTAEEVKKINPAGIILSGSPHSVYDKDAPSIDKDIFDLGIPVLGVCYGAQLITKTFGGKVEPAETAEYGKTVTCFLNSPLFKGTPEKSVTWMSHGDRVKELPAGFKCVAKTDTCPYAAFENEEKKIYAVQYHPEVKHSEYGFDVLGNFLFGICKAKGDWTMSDFAEEQILKIREKTAGGKVLLALSGGVDSAVAAALLHKAVGDRLTCIFVDHGLLRKDEAAEVVRVFKTERGMNLIKVDASEEFLTALKGLTEPEDKRKVIGAQFIKVFEKEAKKIGAVDFLVQGTIYPDVIESGKGCGAKIKSHHNVGGLPSVVDFKEIIEPLRDLFKDEVRKLGFELGLPEHIVMRQPFPGPGLAIRIIGEVTREKIAILQEADYIYRDEIAKHGLSGEIWQYFAVLTDTRTVGVMGDSRTYRYVLGLRGVTSVDGMTADWARIPFDVLAEISSKIVNEVKEVSRVVYDITSKPPATIEWE